MNIVEVTQGGIDYTNPDALCQKYKGEFLTFQGMTKAVETAISIAKQWSSDTSEDIYVAIGCTNGFTAVFEEQKISEEVFAEMLNQAKEFDNNWEETYEDDEAYS